MTYKIVRVVQTCWGFPSQWDAWTDTGQYLYLRYRYGCGTVERFDDPDPLTWSLKAPEITFETADDVDGGMITLAEFAKKAGLTLAIGEGQTHD